ncbi:MAG: hypothetical protein IJ736_15490, partial [Firmicutes bacterium]|nr:hypothetical protein [Bacillota bacterium]
EYAQYLIDNEIIAEESDSADEDDTGIDDVEDPADEDDNTEISDETENEDVSSEDDGNDAPDENDSDDESGSGDEEDESDEGDSEDKADAPSESSKKKGRKNKDTTAGNAKEDKAAKEKKEQKKSNAEKISQKKDFKVWLAEEAEKYNDKKNLSLLKKVFESENGVYDQHSKELLVLIDNFDNEECKKELIDRLWNGNTASRKVFECISGLELPITNLEIGKYFAGIVKADFKASKAYTPVTAAENSKEGTFYIKTGEKFEKVTGYAYSEEDLKMFIRYTENEVVISDVRTGALLSKGTNEEEAKENLRKVIDKVGIDKMKKKLESLESNPDYNKK